MIGASRTRRPQVTRRQPRPEPPPLGDVSVVERSTPSRNNPRASLRLYLQRHVQAMLYSLGRICRQPASSLMTIAVIGIALALPAGMYVALQNVQGISAGWESATQISLFLKKGVDENAAHALATELEKSAEVAKVSYVSPDKALDDFKRMSGFGDALDVLDENPLPAVLVVRPAVEKDGAAGVERLLDRLKQRPEVDIAQLDMEWVKRLFAIIQIGQRGVLVLAVLLALAVLLVVGNTIRLAINSRREEIEIKKLIGATDAFIRRPFLYFGLWFGLFGGLLAWLLVSSSLIALNDPVRKLAVLYDSSYKLAGPGVANGVVLMAISGLLGLLGAWLAVRRHLAEIEPT